MKNKMIDPKNEKVVEETWFCLDCKRRFDFVADDTAVICPFCNHVNVQKVSRAPERRVVTK